MTTVQDHHAVEIRKIDPRLIKEVGDLNTRIAQNHPLRFCTT
ncbi:MULTISPECIES: hypothetical protein [Nostocales]|nr:MULTISPECIES: hypothetical protein [Nostocales]